MGNQNAQRLTLGQRTRLTCDGFVLVRGMLSTAQISLLLDRLECLWCEEGGDAGRENYFEEHTRRLANLADKGEQFRLIFANPLVLEACHMVMGADIRLSMLNARDALPNAPRQPFHCDINRAKHPERDGHYALTAIWMLDAFTKENGATCLIPGSHLTGTLPENELTDCLAPHPDEVHAIGNGGDLLLLNGHCWHAGGENRSLQGRRAILAHYLVADYMPALKDNRQLPSRAVWESLNRQERALFDLGHAPAFESTTP